MAPSTVKRIVVYRFDRQPAEGIVQPATCFLDDRLETISLDGNLQSILYADLKAVCFVSDPAASDLFTSHQVFDRRPKAPGLWTRFTFRDGDRLDGMLPHNLIDWPTAGYLITPPRAGANRQRAFLPRLALLSTEFLGVVGGMAVAGTVRRKPETPGESQLEMFD